MNDEPSNPNRMQPSLAYALGRKSAPLFFKANWILKSLAGSTSEKIKAEFEMGWLLSQVYEEKIPVGRNITSEEKVQELGGRLVACLRNKERSFVFHCDQSDQFNALAIPGGFTYVSEKLVDLCRGDDDALAFVLAHEVAHTINGDANKRFLSKTVIGSLSQLRFHRRTITPTLQKLLARLVQQHYSQDQEYAADRFAIALLMAAKFDPFGSCRLLEKLAANRPKPDPLGAYFASHPPLSKRIEKIKARIQAA